jgi:ATP-dependent Clp protease ATP-binding subunit ClpA
MDEAASRVAMERESVPQEIDEVQRRLQQLELAARQLAGETEETAQGTLAQAWPIKKWVLKPFCPEVRIPKGLSRRLSST